jgi:VWFA-related protein
VLVLLGWDSPAGQAPATFRSRVQVVDAYATVQDAEGRLVPDLPRDAFEVLDNGRPVPITTFSNDPQPITVAVMLDMSGSMEDRLLLVRESARRLVDALQPGDRAAVGSFGFEVAVSPLLTGEKSVLRRVLGEELWPGGATPLWRAVDAAMNALAREPGRRVVLLLTDGADNDRTSGAPRRQDLERRAVRESFMVYAIGMKGSAFDDGVARVAERTGGGHFQLAADADLGATFARVVQELRHQYLLGFEASAPFGTTHAVSVRGLRPGLKVRARQSYQAEAER